MTVFLNSIADLYALCECSLHCEKNVDAVQAHYLVNAKSIMGCFSLDWNNGVKIVTYSDRDANIMRNFVEQRNLKFEE